MATRSAALFSLPNAAIPWETTHAADAADASNAPISIFTTIPTVAKFPTDTAVSPDAADAANA